MTFTDALSEVFDNSARVTRAHWNSRQIYIELVESQLCIVGFSASGVDTHLPHPWTITEQDYFADDWEVVDAD
jgi:hypothetical protein